eukprot:54427-Prorocentrum_lima.AAC.1
MLLQRVVGGEPEAYMPPSLIGGLRNLVNYRRNFGISMGFLPELVPSYIQAGLRPFPVPKSDGYRYLNKTK